VIATPLPCTGSGGGPLAARAAKAGGGKRGEMTTAMLLIAPTMIAVIFGAVVSTLIRRHASGWGANPVRAVVRSAATEVDPQDDEIRIPKAA
jgi:hypothetical protein